MMFYLTCDFFNRTVFLNRIPPNTGRIYTVKLSYMCGGTLLNKYTILTAAHCINTEFDYPIGLNTYTVPVLDPFDLSQYSVYLGNESNYFF